MNLKTKNCDKSQSTKALNCLNFFLADVQGGVGPFLIVFLAATLHWNPDQIGMVMGISGILAVLAQIPAGALIDQLLQKRLIVAAAAITIALSCVTIALVPTFPVILGAQSLIGVAGAVFGPAIAAITLGLLGRACLEKQVGKNQSINSSGNIINALLVGLVGASVQGRGIFWYVAVISLATVVTVLFIRDRDIDYALARGADQDKKPNCEEEGSEEGTSSVLVLLRDRRILIFAISCILFHFANAGIGPLVSQLLAKQVGAGGAMHFMSATIITAQLAIIPLGIVIGRRASKSARKPLYLIPFCLMPVRALLYMVSHNPYYLVGLALLEGAAMGIFGILQLIVIADLTKGTGRFNVAQGALSTAVGLGAASSNFVVGAVVKHLGFDSAFLTMAVVAGTGLIFFWIWMPETQPESPMMGRVSRSSASQEVRPS